MQPALKGRVSSECVTATIGASRFPTGEMIDVPSGVNELGSGPSANDIGAPSPYQPQALILPPSEPSGGAAGLSIGAHRKFGSGSHPSHLLTRTSPGNKCDLAGGVIRMAAELRILLFWNFWEHTVSVPSLTPIRTRLSHPFWIYRGKP